MTTRTTPAELFRRAEQLLDGQLAGTEGNSARLAAVLARQALETAVVDRCRAVGADVERASMRSQLVILRALDDPDLAARAASAWQNLSAACHRHAYELSPSVSEVRTQCESIAAMIGGGQSAGTT